MSLTLFFTTILFLLAAFQALQIYFFKRKQIGYGAIFVFFFWTTLVFLMYNMQILFSANVSGSGSHQSKTIIIDRGSLLSNIAGQLRTESIIKDRNHFLWTANLLGLQHRVQAGKYNLSPYMSNYALILQLTSGGSVQEQITIVEGSTAKEIALIVANKLDLDVDRFLEIVNNISVAERLGIDAPALEGYLFPETYRFNWGISEMDVVEVLVSEFKRQVDSSLSDAASVHNLTFHEAVILASIVEDEAVIDDERPMISAVFHNRLKKNWRLEADPTVQYIIPDGPRRLLDKDLAIDSPYNTYKYRGLPPGPINNPGLKSILAAVNPADESYVYFVVTGEGRHTFSRTLNEHLQAKQKLDQLRRDLRRQSMQ